MRSQYLITVGLLFLGLAWNSVDARSGNRSFRDCPDCPEMVVIPPGSFTMGGAEERDCLPDIHKGHSSPEHRVHIRHSFAIGKYDVTRGEFAAFVIATGYKAGDKCAVLYRAAGRWKGGVLSGYSWRNPNFLQTDSHPVVCVSWDDANAYVAWLSQRTGHVYRLPTEAEWEYAARGESRAVRFWRDGKQACVYANVADLTFASALNLGGGRVSQCSDGYTYTSPVGHFRPNAFGLYDMEGNVWQWTEDCWNDYYHGAPVDGSAWTSGDCAKRVARGSSWYYYLWSINTELRFWGNTGDRNSDQGFRVARTL